MSKKAHTAGPWVIETDTKGFEVCTIHGVVNQPTEDGLGQTWVYVRPPSLFRDGEWHWPDDAEQLANARLIAAAPDLLEALGVLVENVEHAFPALSNLAPLVNARAALSKAMGGE